jgi:hypothetical protein
MQYGQTRVVDVTPDITKDSAYTAGDVVGGLLDFDVASSGGAGWTLGLLIIDEDKQEPAGTLYLFDTAPTEIDDADPFTALTAADIKKIIAKIPVEATDWETLNNGSHFESKLVKGYYAGTGYLYGMFVTTDTPTFTDTDHLTFRLITERN